MTVNLINVNLTLRLATVDAVACLEPQPLVYIDIVSGGWNFTLPVALLLMLSFVGDCGCGPCCRKLVGVR